LLYQASSKEEIEEGLLYLTDLLQRKNEEDLHQAPSKGKIKKKCFTKSLLKGK
jgi:hypothetical protein